MFVCLSVSLILLFKFSTAKLISIFDFCVNIFQKIFYYIKILQSVDFQIVIQK